MKFKIGNKVKILTGSNEGLTGVIACTDNGEYYPYGINLDQKANTVHGDSHSWSNGNSDIARDGDLELISEENMRFNIGDEDKNEL